MPIRWIRSKDMCPSLMCHKDQCRLRGERFLLLESSIEELLEESSVGFDILDSKAEYRALAVDREVPFR